MENLDAGKTIEEEPVIEFEEVSIPSFTMEDESVPDGIKVSDTWPTFEDGEEVEIKGVRFTVARCNAGTIAFKPVSLGESYTSRAIMKKLRR